MRRNAVSCFLRRTAGRRARIAARSTTEAARTSSKLSNSRMRTPRFEIHKPQMLAAAMLCVFAIQCLWVVHQQTLTRVDYAYARCGRELWERPSPLAGYLTSCGNISDGTFAYRVAGLPLTVGAHCSWPAQQSFAVGDAAPRRKCSSAASAAFYFFRRLARRRHLVGLAAAIWKRRRFFCADAVLLFAGNDSRLRSAEQ